MIDPVWSLADFYEGIEIYEASLRQFSQPQRFVWAALWYSAEVNNGGHHQFYSNSTGLVWRDAMLGFKAMELTEAFDIIAESVRRLGGAPSFDRDERNEELDRLNPDFEDLDERFYELEKKIDYGARLLQYIRSRPRDFHFSGVIQKPLSR